MPRARDRLPIVGMTALFREGVRQLPSIAKFALWGTPVIFSCESFHKSAKKYFYSHVKNQFTQPHPAARSLENVAGILNGQALSKNRKEDYLEEDKDTYWNRHFLLIQSTVVSSTQITTQAKNKDSCLSFLQSGCFFFFSLVYCTG